MADNSFVDELREQINKKHREALHALEIIAAYLDEPVNKATEKHRQESESQGDNESSVASGETRVDRVLQVIVDTFKTVEDIASETKLAENAVRAVLYSKFVKKRLNHKKLGKKMGFRLKAPATEAAAGGAATVAALVRDLLSRNPNGLRSSDIRSELSDALEKSHASSDVVGAALYNMKKSGKVHHEKSTGIYRLVAQSTSA
jgi:hypothetical protein